MKKLILTLLIASCIAPATILAQNMSEKKVEKIFKREAEEMEGEDGVWMVRFGERWILVFADEEADRMRIFTPVVARDQIELQELERMLEANFHTAMDAKYGLYNEYVISVYSHPLNSLNELQIVSAVDQVVNLADTFGTTYASTSIMFGMRESELALDEENIEKRHRINEKPGGGKSN